MDVDDVMDTTNVCWDCWERLSPYLHGKAEPHFPVPAVRIAFDVWHPDDTVSGKYELTGMFEWKVGHWHCFVNTDDKWRD